VVSLLRSSGDGPGSSFTFHVVSYQSGNIANWPLVIDTTLAIKPLCYPMGWKSDAYTQYSNHNNYDVLTILSLGWPHMPSARKDEARAEIAAMLDWCLAESVDGDGFKSLGSVEAVLVAPRSQLTAGDAHPIRSLPPATAWLRTPQRRLGRG